MMYNVDILNEHLKNEKYKNVYLFFGEDYFKKNYETLFKKSIIKDEINNINLSIYKDKISLKTLVEDASTIPFFGDYRLVIAKNTGIFDGKIKIDNFFDIDKLPLSGIIIFIEENVDKRTKIYKLISKIGTAYEFETPKEAELISWVIDIFKKEEKDISRVDATYFVRSLQGNMNFMYSEINKLLCYKLQDTKITVKDIDFVTSKSIEIKIFDMLKAVGEKDLNRALTMYKNMIDSRNEPIMILNMLSRQFRIILRTKALTSMKHSVTEIAEKTGVRSFTVNGYISQSKKFKYNTLINALEECLITDVNIKTGAVNGVLGVEKLIVKFSR
ncbi:MAG: DNA polymerase III subunit delta [Defluviitaleaceae bacterium]|nr:DNA polymerase III subunit delta [Defluviitaleaceae bacterium]